MAWSGSPYPWQGQGSFSNPFQVPQAFPNPWRTGFRGTPQVPQMRGYWMGAQARVQPTAPLFPAYRMQNPSPSQFQQPIFGVISRPPLTTRPETPHKNQSNYHSHLVHKVSSIRLGFNAATTSSNAVKSSFQIGGDGEALRLLRHPLGKKDWDLLTTEGHKPKPDGIIPSLLETFAVGIFFPVTPMEVVIQYGTIATRQLVLKNIMLWLEAKSRNEAFIMQTSTSVNGNNFGGPSGDNQKSAPLPTTLNWQCASSFSRSIASLTNSTKPAPAKQNVPSSSSSSKSPKRAKTRKIGKALNKTLKPQPQKSQKKRKNKESRSSRRAKQIREDRLNRTCPKKSKDPRFSKISAPAPARRVCQPRAISAPTFYRDEETARISRIGDSITSGRDGFEPKKEVTRVSRLGDSVSFGKDGFSRYNYR